MAVDPAEYERRAARAARVEDAFLWPTSIAAILCLPVYFIPAITGSHAVDLAAYVADWVIWSVFALELVVLMILAPDRQAWFRHHRLMVFIIVAAFPGFAVVLYNTRLDGLSPMLLLVQKMLKLSKIDRLIRKRDLQIPLGRWLLLAPAVVAVVVIWDKLGWITAVIVAAAFLLGILGPGGKPDPVAIAKLRGRLPSRRRATPV